MANTLLTYVLTTEPTPLQASPQSGNLTTATLTIVATNPKPQNPVTLQGLSVTLPVGTSDTDLTPDATSISPIPPPNWTLNDTEKSPGQVKYVFYPAKGHGTVGSHALTITFQDVEITRQVGTVEVIVTEGSTGNPTTSLLLTKFPYGWNTVSFSVNKPNIPYGTHTTLTWNGPEGATYTIQYTADGRAVNVPKSGQRALANSGQYPGTTQPPLILKQTTTFTLNVSLRINNLPHHQQLQKTVTVDVLPPKISSFRASSSIVKNGKSTSVTLSWIAENTNKLEVQGGASGPSFFHNDDARKWSIPRTVTKSTSFVATAWGLPGYTGTVTAQTSVYFPPLIKKFTGKLSQQPPGSGKISLTLDWDVENLLAGDCEISGELKGQILPAAGPKTIYPSVKYPLESTYTLTASNPAGKATSELTVLWGKKNGVGASVSSPKGLAVSPDGSLLFVANYASNQVFVFDATTLQPAGKNIARGPIKVEEHPWGVAISPTPAPAPYGSRVFVTNTSAKTLSVLMTAQTDPPKVRRYANATAVGELPFGVAVSPDGKRVFVANLEDNTLSVLDTWSLLPIKGTPIRVGIGPVNVAVLPDGSRVFVTNSLGNTVSVIDATTDPPHVVGKPIPVGQAPQGITVSPDGTRVFIANSLSNSISVLDATADPVKIIGKPLKVGVGPFGLAFTPDGSRLFVTYALDVYGKPKSDNTVTVFEIDTKTDSFRIQKPSFTVAPKGSMFRSIAMSPDGTRLFLLNQIKVGILMAIPSSVTGGIGN